MLRIPAGNIFRFLPMNRPTHISVTSGVTPASVPADGTMDDDQLLGVHDDHDQALEQDPEQEQERRNLEVKATIDSLRAHTRSANASSEFLEQLKELLGMAQALPTPVDAHWHAARERQDN